ncbi:hypothetical protein AUK40_04135 [Candidatus Wirthbacteria bacterium CG2_30_54_11]|uniref:Uncharacterized protein n=1 Tax=Candidatus Wirthbacteria bacterium CG2_30_54_11 TaxID=1817892 RepID=A0A1J5IV51_9BACT|nr:MAG: hypothetical protein AUK40_04135 [Candidatus Wirthbacteria bacterium CG2_30_54_11]
MLYMIERMRTVFLVAGLAVIIAVPQLVRAEALAQPSDANIATITEPADKEVLAGMVEIIVLARSATRVEYTIVNETSRKSITLGTALKQGTETWVFSWDTTRGISDGTYTLYAKATGAVGNFASDPIQVTVLNGDDPVTTTPGDDPRILVLTTPVAGATLSGSIPVSVTGQANGVYLFALTQGDQQLSYIGEATEGGNGSWALTWNTASLDDGAYELYARSAAMGGEEWMSQMVAVVVSNGLLRPSDDPNLPVGIGQEYIILEESAPTLVPVDDKGRMETLLETNADAEVLDNATVSNVTLYKLNTSTVPGTVEVAGKTVLQGRGPANAAITINVFSEPIVATTTTDADGNWVYTIDSSLTQGSHEVYMTVSDNSRNVVGRSRLFEFLVSEAVAASDEVTETVTTAVSSNRTLLEKYSYAVGGVIIVVLALFLVIQRIAKKNHS